MKYVDQQLMNSLREVIATEMLEQIKILVDATIKDRMNQMEKESPFEIEDHREAIESMISEYINYNVTVTLEG